MALFGKKSQGVHVKHNKNTHNMETIKMPIPDTVKISMAQNLGAPCTPTVAKGDYVKVGQVIGDSEGFISAPVHSSVSGTVIGIEEVKGFSGANMNLVTIETDKLQTIFEGVKPPIVNNRQEFIAAIKSSGLVGLGGAAFPTHVKFNPKNIDEVTTLVINGAECEPYITADFRCMMEDTEDVIEGIKIVMKHLELTECIIGIEDNKPEAIEKLNKALKDSPEIKVKSLHALYPQGAERVLIYETTGKILPDGKLPGDMGIIVSNVATVAFVSKYMKTGMPLMTKRLTVDGSCILEPKNVEVTIGTKVIDVINFVGGYNKEPKRLIFGGPMMGMSLINDEMTVVKNNNAILALADEVENHFEETNCINCGRCINACPLNLMPTNISKAYDNRNYETLEKLSATLCMNCGCCTYVCPAKKQLAMNNKLAKGFVMEKRREAK